jgi:hypothetical protein
VFPTTSFGGFSEYFVDGRPATSEEIAIIRQFTPQKSDSSRQGTDKKIEIRRPKIENIMLASLGGKRIFLYENFEMLQQELVTA